MESRTHPGEHLRSDATAVARVLRKHGIKPHRIETFKLSNDPRFIEMLEDIVGLYLDPPERALVLSCDEKTHIQNSGLSLGNSS